MCDRDRLTGQRPGCGIEWLHHQGGAAHEDQRVLRNLEVGSALHQPDALARSVECRHVGRNRRNPLVSHVQEVPAVGEEVGETVPIFPARRVAGDDALPRAEPPGSVARPPRSGVVSGSSVPPSAEMRWSPSPLMFRAPTMITLPVPQVPWTFWAKDGLWPIVSTGPPARSTFRSLPSAKNAT